MSALVKNLLRSFPGAVLGIIGCGLAAGCSTFERRLDYGEVASPAMGREMAYAVYTPPGWTPAERLPLVLFLHGGGDSEDCFDRAGYGPFLDAEVDAGRVPRCVICVPNGEYGFWENWFDGSRRYRDWVLDDLVPHVQKEYRTLTGREHLHVAGISMGGHGTLRFALLEPERFESVAAISAPVMNAEQLVEFADGFWVRLFIPVERIWGPTDDLARVRSEDLYRRWRQTSDLGGLRLMLAHGSGDREGIVRGGAAFHAHLDARGIEHDYAVYDGGHDWVSWRRIVPGVLRFLVAPGEQPAPTSPTGGTRPR
ncbi:MAG: esterase family protein [bacterium]|nr:esterase family protein [bacterium]